MLGLGSSAGSRHCKWEFSLGSCVQKTLTWPSQAWLIFVCKCEALYVNNLADNQVRGGANRCPTLARPFLSAKVALKRSKWFMTAEGLWQGPAGLGSAGQPRSGVP